MNISSRVFLVGSPRSGTTLLLSMLVSHTEIISFPESHYFTKMKLHQNRVDKLLGLASKYSQSRIKQFLVELERPELIDEHHCQLRTIANCSKSFTGILDKIAIENQSKLWIEKTPDNVLVIDTIEKHVPRSKFIHIIREGSDVVASLFEVTHKHPNLWNGAWDIDRCINHWKKCIASSSRFLGQTEKHFFINYEDLVASPKEKLEQLCRFLNIKYESNMIDKRDNAAKQITLPSETWKDNITNKIAILPQRKFDQLFTESEKEYIKSKTQYADYKMLSTACK